MLIAIVDDIAEERILLRTRLENILDQKNVEFHCYEYENGEAFLKASKEHDFTVLFLDIYMNGANGIEIAREFRNTNKDCLLIFTTTSLDHALEGFKVRAMHYLVKPYTEEELSSLIDEILSRIPASPISLTPWNRDPYRQMSASRLLPGRPCGLRSSILFLYLTHAFHLKSVAHFY